MQTPGPAHLRPVQSQGHRASTRGTHASHRHPGDSMSYACPAARPGVRRTGLCPPQACASARDGRRPTQEAVTCCLGGQSPSRPRPCPRPPTPATMWMDLGRPVTPLTGGTQSGPTQGQKVKGCWPWRRGWREDGNVLETAGVGVQPREGASCRGPSSAFYPVSILPLSSERRGSQAWRAERGAAGPFPPVCTRDSCQSRLGREASRPRGAGDGRCADVRGKPPSQERHPRPPRLQPRGPPPPFPPAAPSGGARCPAGPAGTPRRRRRPARTRK